MINVLKNKRYSSMGENILIVFTVFVCFTKIILKIIA